MRLKKGPELRGRKLALGFGYLGLWFWAMIDAGNKRKWAWFVLIVLFSPVLFVFYLLFGRRVVNPSTKGIDHA